MSSSSSASKKPFPPGLSPSSSGFGYVIPPYPHTSSFVNFGQHHTISYVPTGHLPEPTDEITICMWLGPDSGGLEVHPYLIYPSQGILRLGTGLNQTCSSQAVLLGSSVKLDVPPNAVAQDLLIFNERPCILFIHHDADTGVDEVLQEADSLCVRTRVLERAANLVAFLERAGVPGDAFPSTALGDWYLEQFRKLKTQSTIDFLFDPSVLVVNLVAEFVDTVQKVNKLQIGSTKVLVPLVFARTWLATFRTDVANDDGAFLARLITEDNPGDMPM